MPATRATWTDERLDDLSRRVEDGFNRVDADIRELRSEMNSRFDTQESKFVALQRTMFQFGGGLLVALVAGFAALFARGG